MAGTDWIWQLSVTRTAQGKVENEVVMLMSRRKALKLVHLTSTAWFMLCLGYILVLALHRAGLHWWVIFSLSGHSTVVVFLLVSLYLFAIFRGASRTQKIEVEHPLTSTTYYTMFYVAAPFLGGLGGCLGMIGVYRISQFFLGIALGTLGTTFLVWVFVDPVTGVLEMLLPASRKHRLKRLAKVRALRRRRDEERKRLLAEIFTREEQDRRRRQAVLQPYAEKLAGLLTTSKTDFKQAGREAVDIGVHAWQMGGLSCMRQLRDMTMDLCKKKYEDSMIIDYVSTWWDGIGSWRTASLG